MPNTGYIHGSDLLCFVEGEAIGHCSSCQITHNTESQERAVKPPASVTTGNTGKWKEKAVTGLSESISVNGFMFYDEAECGYDELLALWHAALPVTLKYAHRGEESTKYYTGEYIITSLEQDRPADDTATYTASFESSGEVTEVEAG
jgi:predicted secreted protein